MVFLLRDLPGMGAALQIGCLRLARRQWDESSLFEERGKGLSAAGAMIQNIAGVEENGLERHR
jgi:hypothetical protein